MKPFQQRVLQEKEELEEKMHKLYLFFDLSDFTALAEEEKARLKKQYDAMHSYYDVLVERIHHFK